jgi:membrane protein
MDKPAAPPHDREKAPSRVTGAFRLVLAILKEAYKSFIHSRAHEGAASIAYFALFSLFPMMLVLVVIGSYFLQNISVQEQLIYWVTSSIPGAEEIISQNIERMLSLRGAFGLVGVVSLLWSASGVFNGLAANINRAWPEAQTRNFVSNRVVALGILGGLVVLLGILLFFDTLYTLLPEFTLPISGSQAWHKSTLWQWFSTILPVFLNFLIFWVIYWKVPNLKVSRRGSFIGALVTLVIWRLFTLGFSLYLGGSFARYELVYGSLGTIVVLMFWVSLTGYITLLGAHLTAAIDRRVKQMKLIKAAGSN